MKLLADEYNPILYNKRSTVPYMLKSTRINENIIYKASTGKILKIYKVVTTSFSQTFSFIQTSY